VSVPRTEPRRSQDPSDSFEQFSVEARTKLRRVFASRFGTDIADDLAAEVLEHAWTQWASVGRMANPLGFLYRVGCSKARRYRRWGRPIVLPVETVRTADSPVDLFRALRRLNHQQRVAVLAVHGYGWSYADVAEILDVTEANVANHVHRGLIKLRRNLE
jgi:RNA polymerase sigma factor (sigma-70 family)